MRKNDVMREHILCMLYGHLRSDYSFAWSKQLFLGSGFSPQDLESIPPFRRDAKMERLRRVLERMDKGSFGICLRCKVEINDAVLSHDPSKRFCGACEREMVGGTLDVDRNSDLQPVDRKINS